jgi:tetrahydromethanopterin S-methyltransferase subunit B
MKAPSTLLMLALSAFLILPNAAEAKLPAKCINRLISKSENQLQNIISSAQSRGSIENVYMHLKNDVTEFLNYKNGSWTRDCLQAAPENIDIYKRFLQTKAQPVLVMAMTRKNELCSAAAEDLINTSMIKIQEKLKTDSAEAYIREFENRLKNRPMITNCAPVKDRVASILNHELPNIKKNIKVGRYISALAWESSYINTIFKRSQAAFKNKTEAPMSTSQNSEFKSTLTSCLSDIKALEENSYPNDGLISAKGKNPITFADAKKSCEEVQKYGVDKFLAQVKTNNENYAKAWKKSWEQKNILGEAMRRTYRENHTRIPAKIEDLGKQIIWTYQSHVSRAIFSKCKTYSFTKDGQTLLGLQTYAC